MHLILFDVWLLREGDALPYNTEVVEVTEDTVLLSHPNGEIAVPKEQQIFISKGTITTRENPDNPIFDVLRANGVPVRVANPVRMFDFHTTYTGANIKKPYRIERNKSFVAVLDGENNLFKITYKDKDNRLPIAEAINQWLVANLPSLNGVR